MPPKDYYDADPPEEPPWDKAMEACCPDCEERKGCGVAYGMDHPSICNRLNDWFREQGEEAEARKYNAELEAGERRDDA